MRLYLSVIVVALVLLSGCSPSLEEALLQGRWVDPTGEEDPRKDYVVFRKDKVIIIHGSGGSMEGSWELLDEDVSITLRGRKMLLLHQPDGSLKSDDPAMHMVAWDGEIPERYIAQEALEAQLAAEKAEFIKNNPLYPMIWKTSPNYKYRPKYVSLHLRADGTVSLRYQGRDQTVWNGTYKDDIDDKVTLTFSDPSFRRPVIATLAHADDGDATLFMAGDRYPFARNM